MDFKMDVTKDYGTFDEKGKSFLAMRRVSWGGREDKLELRKWINNDDGTEMANKGFSFLTDEGPNNLAEMLVENGFGSKKKLIEILDKRTDYDKITDTYKVEDEEDYVDDAIYYDAKDILG